MRSFGAAGRCPPIITTVSRAVFRHRMAEKASSPENSQPAWGTTQAKASEQAGGEELAQFSRTALVFAAFSGYQPAGNALLFIVLMGGPPTFFPVQITCVQHIIKPMKKRLITAYTVFSLLVCLFLILWFVFRMSNTRSENLLKARQDLATISRTATSSYLTAGSFGSTYFSESVLKLVDGNERLRALVISTDPGRPELAYTVSNRYLPPDLDFESDFATPVPFSLNRATEQIISTVSVLPAAKDIRLDAVYTILGRSEVFPIVKELLIGLLAFLLVTAILLILYPHLVVRFEKAAGAGAPARRSAPGPAVEPEQTTKTADSNVADVAVSGEREAGGLYSSSTQLVLERHLEERLSAELKRAASFDQDLVFLLGCLNGLKRTDPFYAELSHTAREYFNFQDLCFEYGDGGIGIIIPNIDIDQGIERIEGFVNRLDRRIGETGRSERLFVGLSARNGRLISGNRIIREAKSALRRAEAESVRIMAFRVDPEKYRNYMASRKTSLGR